MVSCYKNKWLQEHFYFPFSLGKNHAIFKVPRIGYVVILESSPWENGLFRQNVIQNCSEHRNTWHTNFYYIDFIGTQCFSFCSWNKKVLYIGIENCTQPLLPTYLCRIWPPPSDQNFVFHFRISWLGNQKNLIYFTSIT